MSCTVVPHLIQLLLLLQLLPVITAQTEWRQTAFLTDANGTLWDSFGYSVALDDGIVVVGAQANNRTGQVAGAAFLYEKLDNEWTQQGIITADDAAPHDRFGWSVAVRSGIVAVGAPQDSNEGGHRIGAVYVFVRDNDGSWTQQTKLFARDGNSSDNFGSALSIHGATLIVGSPEDDDLEYDSGAVYVFKYEDESWTEQAKLIASDGGTLDWFGCAVANEGDRIIVGSSSIFGPRGSAYIFHQIADGSWTEEAKLISSDGELGDGFGWSLDIHGESVAVGSPGHRGRGGAVYVFKIVSGAWTEQSMLTPNEGEERNAFGQSLSLSDGKLVVGTFYNGPGDAYVFSSVAGSWTEELRFIANSTTEEFHFGLAVAVDRDTVLIGSPRYDSFKGEAYILEVVTPTPEPSGSPVAEPTLLPSTVPTTILPSTIPSSEPSAKPSTSHSISPSMEPCGRWLSRCGTSRDCCSDICRLGRCRLWTIPDFT